MTARITTSFSTESGQDIRRVLREFKARFKGPTNIAVGVPAGAGSYQDGPLLAVVGAVNEFGSADGRVPPRPHLRPGIANHQDEYAAVGRNALVAIANGELTPEQALNQLGVLAVANVQQEIVQLKEPPNAESTIQRKGSSNPLIDTGAYRQSINYVILPDEEDISEGIG